MKPGNAGWRRQLAPDGRDTEALVVGVGLLTIDHAATLLAVSNRTVERLIARGHLPVVRLGRATRVDAADLSELVLARKSSGSYTATRPGGPRADRARESL